VPTIEQLQKIRQFYNILSKTTIIQKKDSNRIIVPTGDGYVIGFSDSSEKPLRLAIDLLKQVEKYNQTKKGDEKLFLRIGLDTGPVYPIKDILTGKKAFWGPGIIMAKRVMDKASENQIFVTKDIAEKMKKLSREYNSLFHSIGEYIVKHDEKIELYNVYGKGFGNKFASRKGKVIKRRESDEERRPKNNFKFKKIELILDVKDPITMMTHHTYIWNLVNISGKTQERIQYQLGGEVKKDLSDLNIMVLDDKNNNVEIDRIDVNRPLYKEFFVKLNRSIRPRAMLKDLKLEYDWEEPDREFRFSLKTDCKNFSCKAIIPNKAEPKVRFFKRVGGLDEKQPLSPKIKMGKQQTQAIWEGKNLKAYDEYIFQW